MSTSTADDPLFRCILARLESRSVDDNDEEQIQHLAENLLFLIHHKYGPDLDNHNAKVTLAVVEKFDVAGELVEAKARVVFHEKPGKSSNIVTSVTSDFDVIGGLVTATGDAVEKITKGMRSPAMNLEAEN